MPTSVKNNHDCLKIVIISSHFPYIYFKGGPLLMTRPVGCYVPLLTSTFTIVVEADVGARQPSTVTVAK